MSTMSRHESPIDRLSNVALDLVFSNLSFEDIRSVSLVCKRFYSALKGCTDFWNHQKKMLRNCPSDMVFNFTKEEKEDASKVRKQVMAALKEIGSLDKPYSKNYCRKFSESVDQLAFDPEYNKLLVVLSKMKVKVFPLTSFHCAPPIAEWNIPQTPDGVRMKNNFFCFSFKCCSPLIKHTLSIWHVSEGRSQCTNCVDVGPKLNHSSYPRICLSNEFLVVLSNWLFGLPPILLIYKNIGGHFLEETERKIQISGCQQIALERARLAMLIDDGFQLILQVVDLVSPPPAQSSSPLKELAIQKIARKVSIERPLILRVQDAFPNNPSLHTPDSCIRLQADCFIASNSGAGNRFEAGGHFFTETLNPAVIDGLNKSAGLSKMPIFKPCDKKQLCEDHIVMSLKDRTYHFPLFVGFGVIRSTLTQVSYQRLPASAF